MLNTQPYSFAQQHSDRTYVPRQERFANHGFPTLAD